MFQSKKELNKKSTVARKVVGTGVAVGGVVASATASAVGIGTDAAAAIAGASTDATTVGTAIALVIAGIAAITIVLSLIRKA